MWVVSTQEQSFTFGSRRQALFCLRLSCDFHPLKNTTQSYFCSQVSPQEICHSSRRYQQHSPPGSICRRVSDFWAFAPFSDGRSDVSCCLSLIQMDNMLFLNTVAQLTPCSCILIHCLSLASKWFPADWKYWHQLIPSSIISQQGDTQKSHSVYLCLSLLICETVTSKGKHFANYRWKVQHRKIGFS